MVQTKWIFGIKQEHFFKNASLENLFFSGCTKHIISTPPVRNHISQLTNLILTNQQQPKIHLQSLHTGFGISLKDSWHRFQSLAISLDINHAVDLETSLKFDRPTKELLQIGIGIFFFSC